MIEGIDISNAQPLGIDWKAVKASGITFAYAKASEGTGYIDPKFSHHVAGAKAAGLLTGAYHYLRVRAGKLQDADKQADGFCDVYLAAGCELLPMLDCEPTGNAGATPAEWLAAIRMWVDRIRTRLGCDPVLYTYPGFWAGLGKTVATSDVAALKLWIAHYTPAPHPTVPLPWKTWTVWQYAADAGVIGQVNGVPGHVDRDKLADIADLMRPLPAPVKQVDPPQVTPEKPEPAPEPEPQPASPPNEVPAPTQSPTSGLGWLLWVIQSAFSFLSKRKPAG